MGELGLPVARSKKGWELAGITKETVDKFSRRTAVIEEEAARLGISNPDEKSQLGAKTRNKKEKQLTFPELKQEWRGRLTASESDRLEQIRAAIGGPAIPLDAGIAAQSLQHAIGHVFERKSVAPEREVLTHALWNAMGSSPVEAVEAAAVASPDLIRATRDGRTMVTTPEVIAEEKAMVAYARGGRGTQPRLGGKHQAISRDWLNADQKAAVRHVWASRDTVTLVRGKAGVGKTTMMLETAEGIREHGGQVFTMAPSAGARDVLQKEGFETAETLARWLEDKKLQTETRGSVLWVDEAGLVSSRDMARLFNTAKKLGNRIIMSGDKYQHQSVGRGAALRMLEEDAGLVPAEIREIQRQKGDYKQVVQSLARGETRDGVERLAAMGWIREVESLERYQLMAEDYVQSIASGDDTLVVSPTHREGERITQAIREKLKDRKLLRDDARSFTTLQNANLTQAERQDGVNYLPGDVVVFHQNAKGHAKGDQLEVGTQPVPVDLAARFQLFQRSEMQLASGDMIRITRNGKSLEGKRLSNGDLLRVAGFDKQGNIRLDGGRTMASDYGHFTSGYCVTSHASQGKSVDRVLIGQSSQSFSASSQEQCYVSVSRAKKQAVIYTDSVPDLINAVEKSADRLTALDLLGDTEWREKGQMIQRQAMLSKQQPVHLHANTRRGDAGGEDRVVTSAFKKSREQKAHAFGRAGALLFSNGEGASRGEVMEGTGLHKRSAEGWGEALASPRDAPGGVPQMQRQGVPPKL